MERKLAGKTEVIDPDPGLHWIRQEVPRSMAIVSPTVEAPAWTGLAWRLSRRASTLGLCGRGPIWLTRTASGSHCRPEEAMGEAYVSAEQSKAGQAARLSSSDVHQSRTGDHQGSAAQGSSQAVGLIWRVQDRATLADLRRGKRSRSGPLTVSFVDGDSAFPPRVAYAIGRKVGNAVERNRLRRRLRVVVRDLASQLRPGAYLIGAAPEAARLSVGELRIIMLRALEAVGQSGPAAPAPRSRHRATP
jgi:ribonuclease P protein component